MYFLLVFGDDVENFLGLLRYIALIAIAAFVGDLVHIASAPNSTIPCIGASGGIAGVITFTPWHFRRRKSAFCGATFIIFAGFACQRGSFSCSGFFLPNHRCLRAEDRNQLGFVLCASGRSRSRPGYVVSYAKNHTSRSGVGKHASGLCAAQGSSPVFLPPSCNFADALYSSDPVRG